MGESELELYGIVGKMLRKIREDHGYSLEAGAEYLGIAPKSLQRYECGERKIKIGTIKSLCEFYNINYDSFITEARLRYGRENNEQTYYTCPECGFSYMTDSTEDIKEHVKEHTAWEQATRKFGPLYFDHTLNEKIKTKNRHISKDLFRPMEERYDAQLEVLRCLFSRSVEHSSCDLNHVSFNEYVAMMLNTNSYKDKIDVMLANELIKNFGVLPGIKEGETTYYVVQENTQPTTIAAHFDGNEYTEDELEEIKNFAEFVKNRRK